MGVPQDQVDELLRLYPHAQQATEAGVTYFLVSQLEMPEGCIPAHVDVLLCPVPRDGYNSRLYFAQQITGGPQRSWNTQARILDRNWHALSWTTRDNLRIAQMFSAHVNSLRTE